MNGHPSLAAYLPDDSTDDCRGYGAQMADVADSQIATITGFPDPGLFPSSACPLPTSYHGDPCMWLTHLEFDATNPFMRHWFDAMGERGRYVRYDAWGLRPLRDADLVGRLRPGSDVARRDRASGFIPMARVRLEGLHGGVCGERQPRGGRGQPAGVLEDAAGRSFPAELAAPPSQAMTMT